MLSGSLLTFLSPFIGDCNNLIFYFLSVQQQRGETQQTYKINVCDIHKTAIYFCTNNQQRNI